MSSPRCRLYNVLSLCSYSLEPPQPSSHVTFSINVICWLWMLVLHGLIVGFCSFTVRLRCCGVHPDEHPVKSELVSMLILWIGVWFFVSAYDNLYVCILMLEYDYHMRLYDVIFWFLFGFDCLILTILTLGLAKLFFPRPCDVGKIKLVSGQTREVHRLE